MLSTGSSYLVIKENGMIIRGSFHTFYLLRNIFKADEVVYVNKNERIILDIFSPKTWNMLLDSGIVTHHLTTDGCIIDNYLLSELAFSETEIPFCIIDVIFKDGKRRGYYKDIDLLLYDCRNRKVLEYFLHIGCRFKTILGDSTMSKYFYPNYPMFLDVIMQYPKSLDKKWLKKNKQQVLECALTLAARDDYVTANIVGQLLV